MKSIVLLIVALFISFGSTAQLSGEPFFVSHYNDSNYVKNRGVYFTFTPLSVGTSINTDNNAQYYSLASRASIHWLTKNYQKFQCFASFGSGYKANHRSVETVEAGLMIGKLIHGRKRLFLDLNVGFAYFSRKGGYSFFPIEDEEVFGVNEIHTLGIPFEAMAYTSKLPIGLGVGLIGNLNVNQPYVNFIVQMRVGNPTVRNHSTLNRNRSSRITSN